MIIEWIASVGSGIGAWIGTLFQPIVLPAWVTDPLAVIYDFLDSASGLGVWFPWQVLSWVVGGLVTIFSITFGAKLVREIVKHIPFVGGAG